MSKRSRLNRVLHFAWGVLMGTLIGGAGLALIELRGLSSGLLLTAAIVLGVLAVCGHDDGRGSRVTFDGSAW